MWVLSPFETETVNKEDTNTLPISIDSFTVPLHSPNGRLLPAVRAVQRDCHWGLNNSWNSHWSREPIMQWELGNPNLSLYQPITKGWCQPIGGHVTYPTDRPIAIRLGLCSSLRPPAHIVFLKCPVNCGITLLIHKLQQLHICSCGAMNSRVAGRLIPIWYQDICNHHASWHLWGVMILMVISLNFDLHAFSSGTTTVPLSDVLAIEDGTNSKNGPGGPHFRLHHIHKRPGPKGVWNHVITEFREPKADAGTVSTWLTKLNELHGPAGKISWSLEAARFKPKIFHFEIWLASW